MMHTANTTVKTVLVLAMLALIPATDARAEIVTRAIEYTHDGVTLEGFLAYDDSNDGRRPGVLVVHEWWGLNDFAREQARWLAEMGYVAFAPDMYGKGQVTNDPSQARELSGQFYGDNSSLMRERAAAGLDVLRRQNNVDRNRIAAIGFCFGGTTVLQLAYSGADIDGVVSFHGSLPSPAEADDEQIRAMILVLHGADDPVVSDEQAAQFQDAMKRASADWQMIYYGGAGHSFTNPAADDLNMPGVAFNADANRRSRRHMKLFFDELFHAD